MSTCACSHIFPYLMCQVLSFSFPPGVLFGNFLVSLHEFTDFILYHAFTLNDL